MPRLVLPNPHDGEFNLTDNETECVMWYMFCSRNVEHTRLSAKPESGGLCNTANDFPDKFHRKGGMGAYYLMHRRVLLCYLGVYPARRNDLEGNLGAKVLKDDDTVTIRILGAH